MADIDLDALLAQRAEARGDQGFTFSFHAFGQEWTALDPMLITDEQKDELADLNYDVDVAAFFMGDEQFDKFVEAGGQSAYFVLALQQYQKDRQADDASGKPSRPNRSARRSAARKSAKQR